MVNLDGKVNYSESSFFVVIIIRSGHLAEVKWSVCNWLIGLVGRMFANGYIIPKTLKMVPDISLLNTQQYKVHIEGKVKQSRERGSALPYTSV